MEQTQTFHKKLQAKMDELVHIIYSATKSFPKEELYGVTSQLRRASLSVVLNYIEGFARKRNLVMINFLEISYGSLKETKYLLKFSNEEGYLKKDDFEKALSLAEEIGAMLWRTIENIKKKNH